ncbi:MAG: amidohydrolase family protein [Myxococcota bacterium]|nr:amidohydrolase family protein [Deltaproteobacteria bacterium]MDQ3338354.1 amidohydrolase family protein [Myxococcota bacterium]
MMALRTLLAIALLATPLHAETIAITNATVYARPDKKLEKTTVVIRDGKIAELGTAAPAGAKIIDGTGKVVTAGLIESSTMLGLITIDLEPAGNDGRFGTEHSEVHAAFRTIDAYNPRSVAVPIARAGGVTSAITGPVGGLVAGQAAWVSLDGNTEPIRFPAAMHAALGSDAVALQSRGYALERLRELLDDADSYRKNRNAFERNQSRKLAAGRLDLEALIPVLEGRVILVVRADSVVDIRALLGVAATRKIKIAIAGGTEAWRAAKELAAANVPVFVDPTQNLPGNLASLDARDDNAALLAAAGVQVAISTLGDPSAVRTLRHIAGTAVANGMAWDRALAAITSVPAQIFGARDRGIVERGAIADVVVWSGDPLETTTRVETVIIGGAVQSLETHQTRLRDRYRKVP